MSENLTHEIIPVEITVELLKEKIYMVRGQQVMLDTDLAEIYGYKDPSGSRMDHDRKRTSGS